MNILENVLEDEVSKNQPRQYKEADIGGCFFQIVHRVVASFQSQFFSKKFHKVLIVMQMYKVPFKAVLNSS